MYCTDLHMHHVFPIMHLFSDSPGFFKVNVDMVGWVEVLTHGKELVAAISALS